jgi:hypothetical protein
VSNSEAWNRNSTGIYGEFLHHIALTVRDRGSDNIHLGLQIKSAGVEGVGGVSVSSHPLTNVLKPQLMIIFFP